jgi:hypothetical protein
MLFHQSLIQDVQITLNSFHKPLDIADEESKMLKPMMHPGVSEARRLHDDLFADKEPQKQ